MQQSHSHHSRSTVDPQQQHQHQHQPQPSPHPSQQQHLPPQHHSYTSYPHPTISQQPPTPTSGLYPPSAHQATSSAAYSASQAQPPDLLNPANQRLRSGSGSLVTPDESQSDPANLKRSTSLNNTMSNPQAGYYPMASPMGTYPPQHQMYSQSSMPQSNYYQTLPQLSSYVDPPRQQQMRPVSGSYGGYNQQMPYSQGSYMPSSYATSYQGSDTMMTPSSSSSYTSQPPMAGSPVSMSYVSRPSPPATLSGAPMHVVDRQKKPQCWDHGCNGREFSTFSNLLRHQREKSGTAAKSYCPHCGAEFTRTTARNGHMEHGKCKTRRTQPGSGSQ